MHRSRIPYGVAARTRRVSVRSILGSCIHLFPPDSITGRVKSRAFATFALLRSLAGSRRFTSHEIRPERARRVSHAKRSIAPLSPSLSLLHTHTDGDKTGRGCATPSPGDVTKETLCYTTDDGDLMELDIIGLSLRPSFALSFCLPFSQSLSFSLSFFLGLSLSRRNLEKRRRARAVVVVVSATERGRPASRPTDRPTDTLHIFEVRRYK